MSADRLRREDDAFCRTAYVSLPLLALSAFEAFTIASPSRTSPLLSNLTSLAVSLVTWRHRIWARIGSESGLRTAHDKNEPRFRQRRAFSEVGRSSLAHAPAYSNPRPTASEPRTTARRVLILAPHFPPTRAQPRTSSTTSGPRLRGEGIV
jgi:hypothetical protein